MCRQHAARRVSAGDHHFARRLAGSVVARPRPPVRRDQGAARRLVELIPCRDPALVRPPTLRVPGAVELVSTLDGDMLSYWAAVDALRALYVRAGVEVPKSETGQTMPWHSLRHSFGTDCAARGVPLATLKELMGHEKIETTLRYVTVTNDQKHEAIARAFGQQVGNKPSETGSRSKSSTGE